MLPPLPNVLPPDPGALFGRLAGVLSEHDLTVIAEMDFGMDADAHLSALRRLCSEGSFAPLRWEPREVLQLTCWDLPSREPADERRHWRRAFSCAALLRASGEEENGGYIEGENQALAVLIDSLLALQAYPPARSRRELAGGLDAPAAALLVWLIPRLSEDEGGDAAFLGLGLLWFALAAEVPDETLLALAEWIIGAEAAAAAFWDRDPSRRWLLDTTHFDLRHDLWQAIAIRLPARLRPRHGPEVARAVRGIATRLSSGSPEG